MMNKDQEEQKWHVCKFCEQSFSNGKKLGGHMRGHLALISASRKQSVEESINDEKGVDLFDNGDQLIKKSQNIDQDDDGMVNKRQQEMDVDQDDGANANNVYVLRENPKRSWRVSNWNSKSNSGDEFDVFCKECGKGFESSKALAAHMRCHSSKESIKITSTSVCEKCGKVFDSMKALYGHMRCHSIKRSHQQPLDESSTLSSNDDGSLAANPIRKKRRSYTRYNKSCFNSDHHISTTSSCDGDDFDDEVEGAICLMMLSRGVRNLDGVKLVISNQADFAFSDSSRNVDFEVSVDGSMEFCQLKNKSKMGLEKVANGSGQIDMGRVGSTLAKYKSIKKAKSCDGDTDDVIVDSKISIEVKKSSKDHICSICFKKFRSSQALGSHKRIHFKTESKAMNRDHNVDIDTTLDLDFDDYGDVKFNLRWFESNIEWDPVMIGN